MTAPTPPPTSSSPAGRGVVRDFPVPGPAERARAWLAGESPDGPEPRLAATVQLLRDGADGLEVFVLERAASMVFAPSMLVFPGGGVDPRDAADAERLAVGDAERLGLWNRPKPSDEPEDPAWEARPDPDLSTLAGAVVVAAVRELFEETGVLLASALPGPWTSGPVVGAADAPLVDGSRMRRERAALDAKGRTLAEVLDEPRMGPRGARLPRRSLVLRSDLLVPVARWVTPPFEPRRYDTFFFRAAVPAGQEPDGRTTEAVRSEWVHPADALAAFGRGELRMLPPTVVALESLAACATVADALAVREPLRLVAPELVETCDGLVLRVES